MHKIIQAFQSDANLFVGPFNWPMNGAFVHYKSELKSMPNITIAQQIMTDTQLVNDVRLPIT